MKYPLNNKNVMNKKRHSNKQINDFILFTFTSIIIKNKHQKEKNKKKERVKRLTKKQMQPNTRTNKRQNSQSLILKLDSRRQTQPPQTRRQYNYLSSYVDQNNQSSTISPYRKLMMTPPRVESNSKLMRQQKQQQNIIPFIISQTIIKQQQTNNIKQQQRNNNQPNKINEQIKQLQRLKLLTKYLQTQVRQLKSQNEQAQRQKKRLNENYISLLNRGLSQQQGKIQQINQLRMRHAVEMNSLGQQLKRIKRQNIILYNEKLSVSQQNANIFQQLQQMKSFQQITQQQYKEIVDKFSLQNKQFLKQKIYLQQKMKEYQGILYKREFEIQQIKMKYNSIEKQLYLMKAERERESGERENILRDRKMLLQQNEMLQQQIQQLQHKIKQQKQKATQTIQQITILLQIDHQKQSTITQQKSTLQTLTRQLQNMKFINDQLLGKMENHQLMYDQERKVLIKQLDGYKERQKGLVENQRLVKQGLEKKTQQVDELIRENQRLYKEINKLKFQHK